MEEIVVLVNDNNEVIGTAPKATVHTAATPLHRGFSLFLFNSRGELLLQQRSAQKKTWPLVWSNSVCGHPMMNELASDAAKRRLAFELGMERGAIYEILPDYRYRAEHEGIVENELCPVLVGFSDEEPLPRSDEVEATRWVAWKAFLEELKRGDPPYSPWCVEEALLLEKDRTFLDLYARVYEVGSVAENEKS